MYSKWYNISIKNMKQNITIVAFVAALGVMFFGEEVHMYFMGVFLFFWVGVLAILAIEEYISKKSKLQQQHKKSEKYLDGFYVIDIDHIHEAKKAPAKKATKKVVKR